MTLTELKSDHQKKNYSLFLVITHFVFTGGSEFPTVLLTTPPSDSFKNNLPIAFPFI